MCGRVMKGASDGGVCGGEGGGGCVCGRVMGGVSDGGVSGGSERAVSRKGQRVTL